MIDHLVKEAGRARESKSYFYYLPCLPGGLRRGASCCWRRFRDGAARGCSGAIIVCRARGLDVGILLAFSLIRAKRPDHILPVYGRRLAVGW
jgi:hypothetical protein